MLARLLCLAAAAGILASAAGSAAQAAVGVTSAGHGGLSVPLDHGVAGDDSAGGRQCGPATCTGNATCCQASAQAALCCWNGGQGIPNSAWYCGGMEPGGMSALCCQPTAPIGCAMYKNCCPLEAPVCCPTTVQGGCCPLGTHCPGAADPPGKCVKD